MRSRLKLRVHFRKSSLFSRWVNTRWSAGAIDNWYKMLAGVLDTVFFIPMTDCGKKAAVGPHLSRTHIPGRGPGERMRRSERPPVFDVTRWGAEILALVRIPGPGADLRRRLWRLAHGAARAWSGDLSSQGLTRLSGCIRHRGRYPNRGKAARRRGLIMVEQADRNRSCDL